MLDINIPGFGELKIQHIVFGFNGTLAVAGSLIDGLETHLSILAKKYKVHIVTSDFYGTVKDELANINCEVFILPEEEQAIAKNNYVLQLDPDHVVAIGSGRNDQQMLQNSRLSIAVLGQEGLSVNAISSAQIVVPDIFAAFILLENPNRLVATLRS